MRNLCIHGLFLASFVAFLPVPGSAALTITNAGNLGTYPIGQDQIDLNATGGSGSYTWSLISGSLPTGLNIAQIPGTSPAQTGLVGIATAPGGYAFTLGVSDGSTSVTQAFTLKITALTVKDINLPDAFAGTAYSYSLTALNSAAPVTFAVTTPALPAGLSLSAAGVLSGTPTTAGTHNIDFSVTDGVDTIFRGRQLFIYAVDLTTPGALPNATQGSAYSATLSASGGAGGYQYALTGGSLPGGLSLSGGVISGTTNANMGVNSFYVTVTDSEHNSYQKTMSIDVVGSPVALNRVTLGTIDDAVVGSTYGWQLPICCGGTAPYIWAATGLPAGMSIRWGSGVTSTYISPGYGEIWGVPTTPGNYSVTVTVTDALGASASLTFPFHVSALSLVPYNLPAGTINSPYSTTFEIIGGSGSYSVAQIGGFLPDGLQLKTASQATGYFTVSGTPLENGNFDPVFEVTDGTGKTLTRNNYFNINNVNGGITINNNSNLGFLVPGNYTDQLTACCVANYVWSLVGGSLPSGATLSVAGLLSGTVSTPGTYTFLIEAADAAGVAAPGFRQFTANVSPIRITTNSLTYGNVGSAYSAGLTATGGTGNLAWAVAYGNYLPAGLTLAANGTLSGTPTAPGQYGFSVTVVDQNSNLSSRFYTINVYPQGVLPPPSFGQGPNLGTWKLGTDQIQLTGNGGNGTYTWSMVSGALPPGLALRTDVPSFFAPNQQAGLLGVATIPGTYNFTLSVTSAGQTSSQAFTVKISALDLQDATPPDAFVNIPFSYTFTPIGNAGPVAFTINSNSTNGALPPGLSLSSAGVLSGTPTTGGNYVIAMNIFDGTNTQYEQSNLDIYTIQITTPGLLPNGTQSNAYSTNLGASGGAGGYSWALSSGGLPAGLTLSLGGTISGTINAGPGLYDFAVTVTDSNQVSSSKRMALDVIGSPTTPMRITNLSWNDPVLGDHYGNVQSVCCGGTAPFTWTVTGLPPGMAAEPNSNSYLQYPSSPGGVQIYGVPQQPGTYNVRFTVTDATGASTSLTVPIHVSLLDVASPSGGNSLPNGTINVPYSAAFRVLGGSGPYTFGKTINGELPDGLAMTPATLTLSGTPIENGAYNPQLLFADSAGNTLLRYENIFINGGTSTININNNGFYGYNLGTTPVNVAFSRQFSACCASSYTWSAGSALPPGLSISASGQLSGVPTTPGTYRFLLDAADATNASNVGVKSFALTVSPVVITTSSLPIGYTGVAYIASLTANGASGAVTWTQTFNAASQLPPGLTLASNGTISGTPTSTGAYALILQATDTLGNIAIRSYTIDISNQALQLLTVAPCRIIDTRSPNGPLGGPFIASGTSRTIPIPSSNCGIPATAVAYSLNITVVPRTGTLGYLTVWPTGQSQPVVSTLNSPNGLVLANAAIVPAGTAGAINAFATDATDLIVDINGYFVPPATGTLQFYPVTPCRVLDTRNPTGAFGGPSITGNSARSFPVPSSSCGVPAGAAAYSFNVTVVPQGELGYLTAWPSGQTKPVVSTLNSLDGSVLANAAIVPAGTNGAASFFATNTTDLIVDINGYFAPPASGGLNFYTVTPCRLVDTRNASGPLGGPVMSADSTRSFPLSGSCGLPSFPAAQAYSLNMTVVPQGPLGYLTTWPAGATQPVVSTLNAPKGQVVANAAIVPSGSSGSTNAFVTDSANVIVDTNGYFGQ